LKQGKCITKIRSRKLFKPAERLINTLKRILNYLHEGIQENMSGHKYRVLQVEEINEEYVAVVQIINKNQTFKIKPEEILANDNMTDAFSQRDIRTLTYLGYLGINNPKYKILAQHLSKDDKRIVFAIKERGKNKVTIKTASELSSNEETIKNFDQTDAHVIGHTSGTEQTLMEEDQKKHLIRQLNKSSKNKPKYNDE